MLFNAAFLLSLVPIASALAVPLEDNGALAPQRRHIDHKCHKGAHIIVTRGHSKDGVTTTESLGGLNSTLNMLTKSLPEWTSRRIHYNNTSTDLVEYVAQGTARLTNMIGDYVEDCPDAKIVLMGYSEGAMITSNTLCGTSSPRYQPTDPLPTKYTKNIIAALVYGDLTRDAGQSYDLGTCKTNGTRARTEPDLCDPYAPVIQSYCDYGDLYCCEGPTENGVHRSYPGKYNKVATQWIESQLEAAGVTVHK